uniref:Mitochondrial import inner membrane translocase subunit TIM50 n=1 Tax=Terrapene triunguis TaxID=2587831 RepID=A0A674K5T6_9SAUR
MVSGLARSDPRQPTDRISWGEAAGKLILGGGPLGWPGSHVLVPLGPAPDPWGGGIRALAKGRQVPGAVTRARFETGKQVIQYQTVRYDVLPLSPAARNRLTQVKRKVLVLDLDETLIHSHHDGVMRPTVRPGTPPDFILKVVIDKHPVRFFVHKRPHVDFFLEVVSQWYELVVFTASMEIYGSAVADKLDNNRSILKRRYYRQVSAGRGVGQGGGGVGLRKVAGERGWGRRGGAWGLG